ncbi:MAG: membrane protein insertion efficiency factor YidD, partial [Candidatus Acidiferrales bacterium]
MGCCDSSTQLGRDGGICGVGAGVVEDDAAARRSASGALNAAECDAGNSVGARNVLDIDDRRTMNSPTTGQGSAAKWLLLLFVRFYQIFFSPFLGGACKFYPSCSRYAQEAIEMHGARRVAGRLRALHAWRARQQVRADAHHPPAAPDPDGNHGPGHVPADVPDRDADHDHRHAHP